ncbi:hypothetical protein LOCC1_G006166 [Lachnellula occidentalis]|uniref:Uncharacterized protein n=1 Tax=Lachnellula occidentalis TaxID=215460 RepID=A0A8H8UHQ7_9HELO|nr:hypothetical protein LOCC1_G006166 [Lachnellula occidentalis]
MALDLTQEGIFFNKLYYRRIVNKGIIYENRLLEAEVNRIATEYRPELSLSTETKAIGKYLVEEKTTRNTPQEYIREFKDYVILQFVDIPRGSRLTKENLKRLDIA